MSASRQPDLITSTKSQTVKKIQSLLSKRKKRIDLGQTIVEGPRMVFDLLDNPKTRPLVQQVVISIDRPEWTERITSNYHSDDSFLVCEGSPEVLAAVSDTVTPQGLVATVEIPPEPSSSTAPYNQEQERHAPLYLLLDGVSDPGNVGTLLRSSVAVGVAGVVLLPGCCDVWNPKAIRSAMGTSFQIPILSVDSWDEAQKVMKNWNVMDSNTYAATMDQSGGQDSLPHYEIPWSQNPSAVMIGSEGNGLSDTVRSSVAAGEIRAVHIPMEPGIESLNAAVCGSVILFEYLRQCRTS